MKSLALALIMSALAGSAAAQGKPPPASTTNAAGVKTRLQALHYKDVQGLRRGPDGDWTGKARQGNIEKVITVKPNGTVIAR